MIENIIIAGKNNIAIEICRYIKINNSLIQLYAVFNSNDNGEDSFQRSFKKYCYDVGIEEISLSEAYGMDNSIFLSLEFDSLIKPSLFKHKKLFNIHFSLLPKYKGMYTSAWPIINGESESGVTLHLIDEGIDTGAIIDQKIFALDFDETSQSLYEKYIRFGIDLVSNKIDKLLNDNYTYYEQPKISSTYYSKKSINYSKILVDYNKTAYEIKKQIDAFTFRSYQLVKFKQHNICGVEILDDASLMRPGELIFEEKHSMTISTVDFDLKLYKDILDQLLEMIEIPKNDKFILDYFKSNRTMLNQKNELGWSPIIVAAYKGRIELLKAMIDLGANVNDTNYKGTSVFMYAKDYAVLSENTEILDRLIKFGADINHRDYKGLNVFNYAANIKAGVIREYFKKIQ